MTKQLISTNKAYRFRRFARKAYAAFNSMHRQVNIGVLAGSMLTFVHATTTSAQSTDALVRDSIPDEVQELKEVLITASGAELNLQQSAKLVTLVTQSEIERQPIQSIQDILKNIVGLDVRQRGSNGVLAGISVRGGTFEQTAVLLNGANLSNPQTAHYTLDIPVNLSDIERIEIIQGPSSLLYGAGAFSGGINIITKKDSESGLYLNAEAGMHNQLNGEVRASLKTTHTSHSLSAGYKSSDGYIANSDYQLFSAFWQSNIRLEEAGLNFQLGYNNKEYGANTFYSAAYPNQYDDTRSIFASLKGEAGTKLKFIPQLYWNRHYDTFHLFRPGTPDIPDWYAAPNDHRTDVFGFNLNTQYKWTAGTTNFGGEIRNEGIRSNVLGDDNRTNLSYFLEHTYIHHRLTVGAGILANYNTAFADDFDFYPSLNLAYWLSNQWKVFASLNSATRMPTFTDLYYKGATHTGNSDVQPEKSESYELGVKYHSPFLTGSLSGFYMKGRNMIDWVKEHPDDLWESRNLTTLDKTGLETLLSFRLKAIHPFFKDSRLDVGYLFIDQKKESGNLISNYVLDYLKHKFTAGLHHPLIKRLSLDWQFRWQDRQGTYTKYEDLKPAYETNYKPFGILDVKINWKHPNWNVYLSINNLFDTGYFDLGNIPQPGFWLMGGVSFRTASPALP